MRRGPAYMVEDQPDGSVLTLPFTPVRRVKLYDVARIMADDVNMLSDVACEPYVIGYRWEAH